VPVQRATISSFFFQDKIQFTDNGAIAEIDKQTSMMLVLGLFLSRGLVSSVLLKPVESGLSPQTPSNIAQSNLKVRVSSMPKKGMVVMKNLFLVMSHRVNFVSVVKNINCNTILAVVEEYKTTRCVYIP
jgi:hypothetical protein